MSQNSALANFLSGLSSTRDDLPIAFIAYLAALDQVASVSPEVAKAIVKELADQSNSLKMIASENYSSIAVQLAMGNLFTDKYAEGHPYHRFYAGCDNVDTVEGRAADLAKELFEADHCLLYTSPSPRDS